MSAPGSSSPATPSVVSPPSDGRVARLARLALPVIVFAAALGLWEFVVRVNDIKPYVLPAPSVIFTTFIRDWDVLSRSLLTTLLTTFEGFVAAAVGGIVLAL